MEQVAAQADSQEVQTIIKGIMQPQKADTKAPNVDAALGLHLAKDKLKAAADENFARNEAAKNIAQAQLLSQYLS
jgi:protein-disulfide isomerase